MTTASRFLRPASAEAIVAAVLLAAVLSLGSIPALGQPVVGDAEDDTAEAPGLDVNAPVLSPVQRDFDAGWWRGVGGVLAVMGGIQAVGGITGLAVAATEGFPADVTVGSTVLLAAAASQMVPGVYLLMDAQPGGPAARSGMLAGSGMTLFAYGLTFGALAVYGAMTGNAQLDEGGAVLPAVGLAALLGGGGAMYVGGQAGLDELLAEEAQIDAASGRSAPRASTPMVPVLSGTW